MSAIVQELGFDASGAIAELRKLDAAMRAVEGRTGSFATAFGSLNSALAPTPTTLSKIAQGASGLGSALGKIAPNASAAAKTLPSIASPQIQQQIAATALQSTKLHTSLALLSRIVFTQFVVSGFRAIRSEIVSAGKSAAAFQKQLAEINNLSKDFTPDKAGAGIRGISDKFGISLPETGKALADVVGNQIGSNPQEQLAFLEEAAALSKSGVATIDSSAQLLSSITNAYGKDVGEVGRVSSILFKTTDLGSVTVEQLAGSMGRVLPQAKLLGVSLEEVAAGFSTLTRSGTNSSESATQIGGSFSSFIKPSKGMQEAFDKLGVSSGEALIAMRGYQGAMQAVIGTTDGSSQSIGKLFPNVRALNAALKLGSQLSKAYADDLKQIQAVPSSLSREKAANVTGTDGQRLAAEAQKLKNAFTVDFGQSVLRSGVALSDFAGGADSVIRVMQSIGPAAIGAGAGVGILTARTRLGIAEGTALYNVLGKLSGGLAAFGLAASGGQLLGNKIADNLFGDFRKKVEDNISALQRFRDAQQNLIADSQRTNTDRIRSALASGEDIDRERLSKIVNRPVTKDNQGGALTEARDRLTAFQQIIAAADNSQKKISLLRGEIRAADTASAGTLGTLGKLLSGPSAGPAVSSIESIRNEILKLSQSSEISEEQITSLSTRVAEVKKFAGNTPATKLGFTVEASSLEGGLERLKQIRELQKSVPGADRARSQAQEIESFLSDLPIASFQEIQNSLGAGVQSSSGIANNLSRAAAEAERAARASASIGSGSGDVQGAESRLRSLDSVIQGLDPADPFTQVAPAITPAIPVAGQLAGEMRRAAPGDYSGIAGGIEPAISTASQLANELERAARASKDIRPSGGGGAPAGGGGEMSDDEFFTGFGEFFHGGMVKPRYFAEGGPVGSDRVPAWLSPGEMVMNRGATGRFFSQLSAMNSGSRPAATTRVGDVHNTVNVGDVVLNGTGNGAGDGRAVVDQIKRLERRGARRF